MDVSNGKKKKKGWGGDGGNVLWPLLPPSLSYNDLEKTDLSSCFVNRALL